MVRAAHARSTLAVSGRSALVPKRTLHARPLPIPARYGGANGCPRYRVHASSRHALGNVGPGGGTGGEETGGPCYTGRACFSHVACTALLGNWISAQIGSRIVDTPAKLTRGPRILSLHPRWAMVGIRSGPERPTQLACKTCFLSLSRVEGIFERGSSSWAG